MRVTYGDARRGSKVADLCDDCAGKMPGRAAAGEVAGRRAPRPLQSAFPSGAAPGPVLWPLYDGKVGLHLLAGPANAGKVALLLERYLARLDDEPFLIVPNRADVARVERDLLERCGLPARRRDRHLRRPVRAARRPRSRRAARRARRPAALWSRRARRGRRRSSGAELVSARFPRLRRLAARGARPSSRAGCSTRPISTAIWRMLFAAYRAELDRARALGSRPAAPRARASGSAAISTPGTASRSSPTASRI